MTGLFKVIAGVVLAVAVLIGGLYALRSMMSFNGRTPEGYKLLASVPGAAGFEPETSPATPVLENESTSDLAVNFGYRVADISYSYSLDLAFPDRGEQGHAKLIARHATRSATLDVPVTRRWDAPRGAYQVAVQDRFDIEPPVPALCLKAVIGPSLATYDLKAASICIAQRDSKGDCHPETLACGQIRQ